jgi:hypothetical protein
MKRRFETIYFDFSKMVLVVEWFYHKDLEFTTTEIPFSDFVEHLRILFGNLPEWDLIEEFNNERDSTRESITDQYMNTKQELTY